MVAQRLTQCRGRRQCARSYVELHTVSPARFITTLKRPATTPSARTLVAQIRTSQPPSEAMSVRRRMGAQSSVIPLAGSHLSAEYVIGHCGVGEDEGDDEKRTDQRKAHAFRRPGRFPDRYGRGNDVRPQADR